MTSDTERRVRDALGAYADLVTDDEADGAAAPPFPDAPAGGGSRRRAGGTAGRYLAVAAAAITVLGIAAGGVYLGRTGSTPARPGASPATAPTGSPSASTSQSASPDPGDTADDDPAQEGPYAALVLRDGDTVTASGRIVSVPGKPTRLCAPVAVALPALPGPQPISYCDLGVDVTGVDLASLTGRDARDGAVEGQARITGVYHDGTIAITDQEPPDFSPTDGGLFTEPPCPAPPGGWPHTTRVNLDSGPVVAYRDAHPGAIVDLALARPSKSQVVMYVLTAGDPAPVEAALRHAYGAQLCVVRSRYTAAQIKAAAAQVIDFHSPVLVAAGIYGASPSHIGPDGQLQVEADVVRVTPELARLAAAQPAGLVSLQPWLRPGGD